MRKILLVLFVFASAFASPPSKELNSDRIKRIFGSYGVEVLKAHPYRVSSLYSIEDGRKITRTLALVEFAQPMTPELQEALSEIENGGSIGSTLRSHGWSIQKTPLYFGSTTLPPNFMAMMNEKNRTTGEFFVYQLSVSRNSQTASIPFCTIFEIYSPQYLTREALEEIYGMNAHHDLNYTPAIEDMLSRLEHCL